MCNNTLVNWIYDGLQTWNNFGFRNFLIIWLLNLFGKLKKTNIANQQTNNSTSKSFHRNWKIERFDVVARDHVEKRIWRWNLINAPFKRNNQHNAVERKQSKTCGFNCYLRFWNVKINSNSSTDQDVYVTLIVPALHGGLALKLLETTESNISTARYKKNDGIMMFKKS